MTAENNTTRGACPASAKRREALIADIAVLSAAHLTLLRRGFNDGVDEAASAADTLEHEVNDLDARGMVGHEPDWMGLRPDSEQPAYVSVPCRYCGSFGLIRMVGVEVEW